MSTINAQAGNSSAISAIVTSSDGAANLTFQTNGFNALVVDSNQNAKCATTNALKVPVGTSAQRPASPVNGMIRFNTSTNRLEGYANSTWVAFL